MKIQSQIIYRLAEFNHLNSLIECVQQSFPSPGGETIARILDIRSEDYFSFTRMVCEKAVAEKLSWVAISEMDRVVGFCISEPMSTAPLYRDFNLDPKFSPLFALLEELDNRYLITTSADAVEIFHLYMLGVLPAYSGNGIGRALLKGSLNFAREKGFTSAVAEATGEASQGLCKSLGFETKASVAYDSFVFGGKRPFKNITEPRCCTLVERMLCQP